MTQMTNDPDKIAEVRERTRKEGNTKQEIIAVLYDHGADQPKNPRWYENIKMAERSLVATMANKDDLIAHYPEDFSIIQIANYDPMSGTVTPVPHKTIITGAQAMKQYKIQTEKE